MIHEDDALANLAALAGTLPKPYLVTGPQAAYIYHRWLQPISKMIDVCIPDEGQSAWQAILRPPWTVLTQPPGLSQVRLATRLMILESDLTEKRYERRVFYQGLAFISAEDLCLDLLRKVKTQIGLSEIAALLIKQKDTLDWAYLFRQTSSSWLGSRLREIVQMINDEAGCGLLEVPGFEVHIPPPPNLASIHPESLKEILRPQRAQLADAQPA